MSPDFRELVLKQESCGKIANHLVGWHTGTLAQWSHARECSVSQGENLVPCPPLPTPACLSWAECQDLKPISSSEVAVIRLSPGFLHFWNIHFKPFIFFTARSNPWPSECLPHMKCTPQQCRTQSWSYHGTFSVPLFRQTLIWPRIWPASVFISVSRAALWGCFKWYCICLCPCHYIFVGLSPTELSEHNRDKIHKERQSDCLFFTTCNKYHVLTEDTD